MKKHGLVIIGLLLIMPFAAHAEPSYFSFQCTETKVVNDLKGKEKLNVVTETNGASVTWNQDGLSFSIDFSESEPNRGSKISMLSLGRVQQETGADGKISKEVGHVKKAALLISRQIKTAESDYQVTRTYSSDTEYIATTTAGGKTLSAIKNKEQKMANGSQSRTTIEGRTDYPEQQMSVESVVTECHRWPVASKEALKKFNQTLIKSSKTLNSLLSKVEGATKQLGKCSTAPAAKCQKQEKALIAVRAARDKSFFSVIEPKRFLPPIVKPPSDDNGSTTSPDNGAAEACAHRRLDWMQQEMQCRNLHGSRERDECMASIGPDPGSSCQ